MSSQEGGNADLGQIAQNDKYDLTIKPAETPEERQSRLKREEDAANFKRHVFWAVFTVLIVVASIALAIAIFSNDTDTRTWARTVISAVVAGIIGFVGGNANKASS